MELMQRVTAFEQMKKSGMTTSDRIKASREAKSLILELNEIYKIKKDEKIMAIMKRLTVLKRKIEKRLRGNLSV
ncbi:hypothetical protein [Poritiphilus flavus]|uniref:Uncharacterized protein n=1 Tax=Poritiphilus flavus TaxID=2697053 RepID=A0A6L9EBK9_9FLAO|nr:hypothetical protein [Poritiphilus flavus]NAS12126.1 hypothetical protein [Poritiphilus flavus]